MMIHLISSLLLLHFSINAAITLPGCQDTCGNITIPYPFGIEPGCFTPGLSLTCNDTYNPPKLFLSNSNIRITQISSDNVFIQGFIARDCYNEPDVASHVWTDLRSHSSFTFSYTRNRFTVIGCDSLAVVYSSNTTYKSGCFSLCHDKESVVDGSCSGIGCCQTAIPKGLRRFDASLRSVYNHRRAVSFSPCSFAFLIDDEYEFNVSDFVRFRERDRVPVVLDWAVGNVTCREADMSGNLLCGVKSKCLESTNGSGYRCSCVDGYQGNPYLSHGCQDINECADPKNNPCVDICTNTPGSYICSCSRGSRGDGKRDGSGCTSATKSFPLVQIVLGSGLSLLLVLVVVSLSYWGVKKRRLIHLKEVFFKQNGGLLLQQQISTLQGAVESTKIFTTEELAKATDNYNHSRILGKGGSGTVYKGTLPDTREVAIKKSMLVDETQIEQFINEVVILSQVIHRNVVKILGCCLETEVPLLVYEYVPNGTLFQHLHNTDRSSSLSWESRLRIASETAGALAYLHSATSRPIFHRDVKSSNILLDENYTAKVSDFGASRLVPLGRSQLTTLVQGTLGYLDPEYFHTGQLTDKSDVYSFGVVLAELLTGETAISSRRSEEERSLSNYFILSVERNRLFEILEPRVANEGDQMQLQEISELVLRCLRLTGEERPTMKEVAEELERTGRLQRHPWTQQADEEELGSLLGEQSPCDIHNSRSI